MIFLGVCYSIVNYGYLCNEIQHFSAMAKITVQNTQITVLQWAEQDYISLTDMASAKGEIVDLLI